MNAYFSAQVGSALNASALLPARQLVDLSDQCGELGNEFYNAFRDDCNTEVHALCCSLCYRISDVVSDLGQGHLLCCNFFGNQADVRLGFQCALQSNMGSAAAHNLDEVPVFLSGVCISLDVTD